MTDTFSVRAMTTGEVALAVDWAGAEGWNPGLHDAACFTSVDPQGFWLGAVAGDPVATISVVNYDDRFSFLGFYIVRPDVRGRGHGLRTWQAGMAHAGARVVGLDGVVAQQENYRKSGFSLAYRNIRFGGRVAASPMRSAEPGIVPLASIPFEVLEADDATVFPAPRPAFLRAWIDTPGHVGRALLRDGKLVAWGVIRPCRQGFKIGPLVADDRAAADAVLDALLPAAGDAEIFLDVPEVNRDAVTLATSRGLKSVFETARMYTGPIRPLNVGRIFGVTTFELG